MTAHENSHTESAQVLREMLAAYDGAITTLAEGRDEIAQRLVDLEAPVRVEIPGNFMADFDGGGITNWRFEPAAGYAGYFGPHFIVTQGTPAWAEQGTEQHREHADRVFWPMVEQALAHNVPLEWEG